MAYYSHSSLICQELCKNKIFHRLFLRRSLYTIPQKRRVVGCITHDPTLRDITHFRDQFFNAVGEVAPQAKNGA